MFQRLPFSPRKAVQAERNFLLRTLRAVFIQNGANSNARILALAGICGLLFSAVFAHGTPKAFAIQAAPHYAESYYVTSTNTNTAYNHGCSQGKADASHHSSSMVVLDFGGQQANGGGVINWVVGNMSNSQVEAVAEAFAHGYWYCTGSDTTTVLDLAIGTNNSASDVSSSGGNTWAHVASAVQSYDRSHGYSSQVIAMGGDDMEPAWAGWSGTEAWATGYSNAGTGTIYTNFGSADNCPTTTSNDGACANGWHQYGVWYVSWGARAAVPTPEIYHGSWALQWKEISLYGYEHQGGRSLNIWGPMSTPAYITPTAAWNDLWNALNSNSHTAQNMYYLLNIDWKW